MSFVQWVAALALLAIAVGGGYGGAASMLRRNIEVPPYRVEGRGAIVLGLLYFAGGVAALVAGLLVFLSK